MEITDQVARLNPVYVDSKIEEVFNYFRTNQDEIIVPVVDQEYKALGILRERDLKEFVYAQYGKEVLLKKSISDFLREISICDIHTRIDTFLELFTQTCNADGIIITRQGEYFGFLNATALIKLLYEKNLESRRRESVDSLIVGIAHELNTPIGISITAVSYMSDKVQELGQEFAAGKMRKSTVDSFISNAKETCRSLMNNLGRASGLVQSFKQVSVDRQIEDKREINVREFVQTAISGMEGRLEEQNITVKLECDEEIVIETYPESFNEALKILIDNSLVHGFDGYDKGKIKIELKKKGEYVRLKYEDDGCGIDKDDLGQIFEPFYTTKRGAGNPGLGLHVLQNMIVHKMHGIINCKSDRGEGLEYTIQIPLG